MSPSSVCRQVNDGELLTPDLQGEDISTKTPVKISLYNASFTPPIDCEETIYISDCEPAPRRFDPSQVSTLGTISWSSDQDNNSKPTMVNSLGQAYHKVDFDLCMTVVGKTVDFSVQYKGKQVGSRNAKVALDGTENDSMHANATTVGQRAFLGLN